MTEACCKKFGGRLLFVATGQTALTGTPLLQKLQGRFRVPIELSDTDVETVIRQVILAKKPDRMAAINQIMTDHQGEISRHLMGTKLEHRPDDSASFVLGLSPPAGAPALLGAHPALRGSRQGPWGSSVISLMLCMKQPGKPPIYPWAMWWRVTLSFIRYATKMLQTGVLPREIYEQIKQIARRLR